MDTSEREPFARLALRVNQYLSAAEPVKEGENEEELNPVDMSIYGFRDVPEVLDLCTAVSMCRPGVYGGQLANMLGYLARLEFLHLVVLLFGTDRDGDFAHVGIVKSLV